MNFQPIWSPNGQEILFIVKDKSQSNLDIYKINVNGTGLTRLTDHPERDNHPVWLFDGRQILFQSTRAENIDMNWEEIYLMNSDGSNPMKLDIPEFRSLVGGDFARSPNSQQIAFSSMGDIYVMDWQARKRNKILRSVDENETFGYASPIWSPNGKQLALKSNEAGKEGIILVNSDGSNPVQISMNHEAYGVSWSPDSQQILYTASRWVGGIKGGKQIDQTLWIAKADGSGSQQRLATGADGVWSPVGQRIIFGCPAGQKLDEAEQWIVCLVNADGTDLVKLDHQGMSFAWSPDGQKVALFVGKPGSYHLYVMNQDGSELKKLAP